MNHSTGRPRDWRDDALCRSHDPELFFPVGQSPLALAKEQEAKSICWRCPTVDACLQYALDAGIDSGIYGGLTEVERRSLRRSVRRGRLTPDDIGAKAERVRASVPPGSLRMVFDTYTAPLDGGHLAWSGPNRIKCQGVAYTPKRLAFLIDRNRQPQGRVLVSCTVSECVLPAHMADDEERMRCGTRPGYQRHRRDGTEICGPCRQANTDANNRLLRTGSTKAQP